MGRKERSLLLVFLALALLLVLPNLGATSLWQDEAQTAVVARNLLAHGYPAARDGENLVSYFADHRDVRGEAYVWHPWFPVYLTAGSLALFGSSSFAARLPFALSFAALVAVAWLSFIRWHADRCTALIGTSLILTSVPMLLHARQCKYYILAALLALLVADAYLRLLQNPSGKWTALLVLWFSLLFNSFYPGALPLSAALALHWLVRRPAARTFKYIAAAGLSFVILNLPLAMYCRIWDRHFGFQPGYSDPSAFALYLLRYLLTINNFIFPLIVVVVVVAWKGRTILDRRWLEEDFTVLALAICAVHVIAFSLLSDYPFTRYMIGMAPFLMFLAARSLRALSPRRSWPVWLLLLAIQTSNAIHVLPLPALSRSGVLDAVWHATGVEGPPTQSDVGLYYAKREIGMLAGTVLGSPLFDYAGALLRPPAGPIDGIVEYLAGEAAPGDRVKIAYGDLPLMFHTDLSIVSASEVGAPAPEWIIPRRAHQLMTSPEFSNQTSRERYRAIELPVADLPWNNRPDPLYHYYRTPAVGEQGAVTLFRKQ